MAHSAASVWSESFRPRRSSSLCLSQRGAEVVQLAVMIPIVLGVVLTVFHAFQLVSLRSKMRSTASQMAQYITAYALPPQQIESRAQPDLSIGLDQIVERSLGQARSNTGVRIVPEVQLYYINDPKSDDFHTNSTPVDPRTFVDRLQPNQQFVVEIKARVNLLWLVGDPAKYGQWVEERSTETITERAFGVAPGEPFMVLSDPGFTPSAPGSCNGRLSWNLDSSFLPERTDIFRNSETPGNRIAVVGPLETPAADVDIRNGHTDTFIIKAICGAREEILRYTIGCNVPEPTPTP